MLSKQKSRRDRLPEADRTEVLSPLPVAELRKYEAVKKAHPDALVCFAQNGYFELYGKDAEKAAPMLGTKLLEKKVRGKPSMPVTGFREGRRDLQGTQSRRLHSCRRDAECGWHQVQNRRG